MWAIQLPLEQTSIRVATKVTSAGVFPVESTHLKVPLVQVVTEEPPVATVVPPVAVEEPPAGVVWVVPPVAWEAPPEAIEAPPVAKVVPVVVVEVPPVAAEDPLETWPPVAVMVVDSPPEAWPPGVVFSLELEAPPVVETPPPTLVVMALEFPAAVVDIWLLPDVVTGVAEVPAVPAISSLELTMLTAVEEQPKAMRLRRTTRVRLRAMWIIRRADGRS